MRIKSYDISVKREVDIIVTPKEVARIVSNYNDDQQVSMLNELARIVNEWDNPYVFQLQSITDHEDLTDQARQLMKEIGNYSDNRE